MGVLISAMAAVVVVGGLLAVRRSRAAGSAKARGKGRVGAGRRLFRGRFVRRRRRLVGGRLRRA